MSRPPCWPALGALLLLLASPAAAQNYQQVAPPTLPTPPPPRIAVPPAPNYAGGSSNIIIPALRGIHLVGAPAAIVPTGVATPGVSSTGVAFAPDLATALGRFLGKPASFATLRAIQAAITGVFRARSHPFVDVVLPRQNVASGVVQIIVAEYRVDRVIVTGNRWFATGPIEAAVRDGPGATIDISNLTDDVAWLNRNPFRQVDMLASPGARFLTTDLNLVVHDKFPAALTLGYDNSGNASTGYDRWKFGVLASEVWGPGVQFGYQLTTSDDFFNVPNPLPGGTAPRPAFVAHSLSFTVPLPWRDMLRVFGDYERVVPRTSTGFTTVGHSGQASLRYDHDLPGWGPLVQRISAGYDFKTTNNNVDFGGTSVFATTAEVNQFPIIYAATLPDNWGQTTFAPRIVLSPGGMTANNTDAAFQSSTPGARASYAYIRLDAERRTLIGAGIEWRMRLSAQAASTNLLPTEQLSVGGFGTVRGYPTYVAGGSEGVVIGEEVLGPPERLLGRFGVSWLQDRFRPDVFLDYAHVFDVHTIPGNPAAIDLAALGIGGHYALGETLDVRVQAGMQFHPVPGHSDPGTFVNVALQVAL